MPSCRDIVYCFQNAGFSMALRKIGCDEHAEDDAIEAVNRDWTTATGRGRAGDFHIVSVL